MTSIEIFLRVGMDPDAREVATLHRWGHEAMAWPAGAIGHLRLVRVIHYSTKNGAHRSTLCCRTAHGVGLHPIDSVRMRHANNRLCGIRLARIAKTRMCLETQSRPA